MNNFVNFRHYSFSDIPLKLVKTGNHEDFRPLYLVDRLIYLESCDLLRGILREFLVSYFNLSDLLV